MDSAGRARFGDGWWRVGCVHADRSRVHVRCDLDDGRLFSDGSHDRVPSFGDVGDGHNVGFVRDLGDVTGDGSFGFARAENHVWRVQEFDGVRADRDRGWDERVHGDGSITGWCYTELGELDWCCASRSTRWRHLDVVVHV